MFVVSRFASTANRRIHHILGSAGADTRTVLVRQAGGRPERQIQHIDVLDVSLRTGGPYLLNVAMAVISSIGLGTLFRLPLSVSVYMGAFRRVLFKALRAAVLRGEACSVVIV